MYPILIYLFKDKAESLFCRNDKMKLCSKYNVFIFNNENSSKKVLAIYVPI